MRLLCIFSVLLLLFPVGPVFAQSDILSTVIGVIVNEGLKQSQQQGGTTTRPFPRTTQSDPTVLRVQQRLDALGYDVGRPDGVMGSKTRDAIAQYQASIGASPTGQLTAAQAQALLGGQPAPGQVVASTDGGGEFRLLYDTDLPNNDFRSGTKERGLRSIDLDGCQNACTSDGRCVAFTFNGKARVCFLKSAVGGSAPFDGAISGVRISVAGGDLAFTHGTSRELTRSEIIQLQQALNASGYDAGKPDGKMGGKTRSAIADFLSDHPGTATQRIDVALLKAVLSPNAGAGGAVDTNAYRTLDEAERDFALIAVIRYPQILDDPDNIKDWLEDDAHDKVNATAETLMATYRASNAVEQKAVLDQYRAALLAEAEAFAADPAKATQRLKLTALTQVGTFVAGNGVAVGLPRVDFFTTKKLDFRADRARTGFVGVVLSLPDRPFVPVSNEAEASSFLDSVAAASGSEYVYLTAYVTVSNFGTDANVSGVAAAGDDDVPVTVSLDRLSVLSDPRSDKPQTELAVLFAPGGQTTGGAAGGDAVLVAQSLGIPVIEGHIAVPADSNSAFQIDEITDADYESSYARLINLGLLRMNPALAENDLELVAGLMSTTQRIRVFGSQDSTGYIGGNEFDRRRAMLALTQEVIPELVSLAPVFPMPVVSIKSLVVGEYDFSRQAFPLNREINAGLLGLPRNLARIEPRQTYNQLPVAVAMDEVAAEEFSRDIHDRRFFLAVFGTLSVDNEGFQLVPERIAIYRDADLTTKLADLELTPYVNAPPALPEPAPVKTATAPPPPAPTADQLAIKNGSIESPQSRFDLLGIKLGMPVAEAKAILVERLKGKRTSELTIGETGTNSLCRSINEEMAEELGKSPGDGAAIRQTYAMKLLDHNCNQVLGFAFGFDVVNDEGDRLDRIVVLRAVFSGDVVGAVIREVPSDMLDALENGLAEKYGAGSVSTGEHSSYWPEHPSMAAQLGRSYPNECDPVWPEIDLPQVYFQMNCGAFVRQLYEKVMLIDTRYNVLQYTAMVQRLAQAEATKPKPKVDF